MKPALHSKVHQILLKTSPIIMFLSQLVNYKEIGSLWTFVFIFFFNTDEQEDIQQVNAELSPEVTESVGLTGKILAESEMEE